jgi:hypothetical protein
MQGQLDVGYGIKDEVVEAICVTKQGQEGQDGIQKIVKYLQKCIATGDYVEK